MADDEKDDKNRELHKSKQAHLSDEVIEQVKSTILYGVGYKRPPENTRFKKGQSGNPKGRPKVRDLGIGGDRSANALALKEAGRLISVREGEAIKEMPAIEAVLRAQYASASRGNAYAQKHIIERYDHAERERRRQIREENEIWKSYVAEQRRAIAEAERQGETPPRPLPHPDDVVIDDERGVRFIGPVDEEQAAQLEVTCKVRDILIQQDALDQREAAEPESEDPLDRPSPALLLAHLLNQPVPDRFKLSDTEIALKMTRYGMMPKRQLLKELYRAWREVGVRTRRGRVSPPLHVAMQAIEQRYEMLAEIRHGGVG